MPNLYRILLDICNRKSRKFRFSQIVPECNIISMVGLEHVLEAQKMFFMTSNKEFHCIIIFEKSLLLLMTKNEQKMLIFRFEKKK